MNKQIALLTLTASLLVCGCGKNQNTQKEETNPNEINFVDCEEWGPSFQTIGLYNSFGRVSRNEDAKYVKSGKYSAHLQPVGSYNSSGKPTMYWNLSSSTFNFSYGDLSYFQKVEMDLFNASEEDIVTTIGFVSSISSFKAISLASGADYTLKAGEWTHVVYEPDISILNSEVQLTNVAGLYVQFENPHIRDVSEAKSIYVDDIKIINSPTKRVVVDLFTIKPNEICDFESPYMKSSLFTMNVVPDDVSFEIIDSFTDDKGLVINPTHGKGMLHIKNKSTGDRWANWSSVRFSNTYLNKTDIRSLEGVESGQWAIRYEIRFANDGGVLQAAAGGNGQTGVFPELLTDEGGRVYIPKDGYVKDKWFTVEVPFCRDIVYYTNKHITVEAEFANHCNGFGWTIGNETHDVDVFIDNIRLSRLTK